MTANLARDKVGNRFDRFYVYFHISLYTFFYQGQEIRNTKIVKEFACVHVYICRFHLLFFQQNSVAVFRELCGVSVVANLMQCVLALGSRVSGPDGMPLLLFDLRDHFPSLEPQGPLPDVLRRVVATYEMVRKE